MCNGWETNLKFLTHRFAIFDEQICKFQRMIYDFRSGWPENRNPCLARWFSGSFETICIFQEIFQSAEAGYDLFAGWDVLFLCRYSFACIFPWKISWISWYLDVHFKMICLPCWRWYSFRGDLTALKLEDSLQRTDVCFVNLNMVRGTWARLNFSVSDETYAHLNMVGGLRFHLNIACGLHAYLDMVDGQHAHWNIWIISRVIMSLTFDGYFWNGCLLRQPQHCWWSTCTPQC